MKKNILIVALVCFIAIGCNFKSSMQNLESDKEDGDKVANELYSLLSEDKFAEAEKLFGEEFFALVAKDQLDSIFTKNKNVFGKFKGNKLVDWKTEEVSGSMDKTEYKLAYEVEYEKGRATETFLLIKKDNGPIKIVGYHVDSPAFLKQ